MPPNSEFVDQPSNRAESFATTHWSVVVAAGLSDSPQSRDAFRALCELYWFPVYSFVRRTGQQIEDARDSTQEFFLFLLNKRSIGRADPERGRFRAFLLTSLKNFLANQRKKVATQRRGGRLKFLSLDYESGEFRYRIEAAHDLTPEKLFERQWVLTLLEHVLDKLKTEHALAGHELQFDELKGTITGKLSSAEYQRTARVLGITEAAVKQLAYRLRKRYRDLFRLEVGRTVESETEIDEEIGRLLGILRE